MPINILIVARRRPRHAQIAVLLHRHRPRALAGRDAGAQVEGPWEGDADGG